MGDPYRLYGIMKLKDYLSSLTVLGAMATVTRHITLLIQTFF